MKLRVAEGSEACHISTAKKEKGSSATEGLIFYNEIFRMFIVLKIHGTFTQIWVSAKTTFK